GIGIAPEQIGAVFREFTQADSTTTRRYGGTGLGLAISQRLVRLMGGEITVTSEVGRGSEFSFTLAFAADVPASRAARLATLGGRRMLIVDDNQTNRRILREMLGAEGIKVEEATTASEGLAAMSQAATKRAPYDLAILDVQMPDMDGFQLATAVRADRGLARTRLLMLTSAGQRGDGERCRELGIRGYLTKPMSRADLLEALGTVLAGPEETTTPEVVTRHTIAESRRAVRVLLAEDNPVNQQVAVAMLVKRGHEVHVAGNGREAVDAITQREYDVVLMDIQMPEMDGFEATHAIRALAGEGVGREADDRQILHLGQRANRVGGLEAIHLRHLDVHQHHVVFPLRHRIHRFPTVARDMHLVAAFDEHRDGHLLIHRVVFRQQH